MMDRPGREGIGDAGNGAWPVVSTGALSALALFSGVAFSLVWWWSEVLYYSAASVPLLLALVCGAAVVAAVAPKDRPALPQLGHAWGTARDRLSGRRGHEDAERQLLGAIEPAGRSPRRGRRWTRR